MKSFIKALIVLSLGVLCIASCTKSSPIGSELVEQDQADVRFTDTLTLRAISFLGDSVEVFSPDNPLGNYLAGYYEDPEFGLVRSSIYSQLSLDETDDPAFVGRDDVVVDSVVLTLAYDTLNSYGDFRAEPHQFEIWTVEEEMERGVTYYSNKQFDLGKIPIGEKIFRPNFTDSLSIISYRGTRPDTQLLAPHLRIPLTQGFGNVLVALTEDDYSTVDNFRDAVMGIHIRPIAAAKSMLSFDLLSPQSRVTIYYTLADSVQNEYNYPFTFQSVKTVNYEHDYAGKDLLSFLEDPVRGDSLIFLQGMAGINASIEIPFVSELGNIIVNRAVLEFTIASNDEDFAPIDRILLSYRNMNGAVRLIDDVNFARRVQQLNIFGGRPREVSPTVMRYEMNIAGHFQEVVDGTRDNVILIVPLSRTEVIRGGNPARSIMYGPGHSVFPAKLRLTYTKL